MTPRQIKLKEIADIKSAREKAFIPEKYRNMNDKELYAFQDRMAEVKSCSLLYSSRFSDFRPTTDDFYGNFLDNIVGINIGKYYCKFNNGKHYIRICGNDDYSLLWIGNSLEEIYQKLEWIPKIITKQDLWDLGFKED